MEVNKQSGINIFKIIVNSEISFKTKFNAVNSLLMSGSNPNFINTLGYTTLDVLSMMSTANYEPDIEPLFILLIDNGAQSIKIPIFYNSLQFNYSNIVKKLIEIKYIPKQPNEASNIYRLIRQPGLINEEIKDIVKKYIISHIAQTKRLDPARLTGATAPSTAFVMMGHGSELPEIEIVPPGCIIVVQVHSGELNYINRNTFLNIFNDPEKIKFLDPVTNYKYINDKINSTRNYTTPLAIYREGDEYPNFSYTLLSYWDSEDGINRDYVGQANSYLLRDSGVVKFPFDKGSITFPAINAKGLPSVIEQIGTNIVQSYHAYGKEIFLNLFNKSEYPTSDELAPSIELIEDPKTFYKIINDQNVLGKLRIRQSNLFKKMGPGVYYNLVCRATNDSLRIVNQNVQRSVINNNQRSLVNASGHIIKNKREILQGIEEAELHRKNLIAKLNKNNPKSNPIFPIRRMRAMIPLGKIDDRLNKGLGVNRSAHNNNTRPLSQAPLPAGQNNTYTPEIPFSLSNNERPEALQRAAQEFRNRQAAAEANALAKVSKWQKKVGGRISGGKHTYKNKNKNKKKRNTRRLKNPV
jgi:hypothetical protein